MCVALNLAAPNRAFVCAMPFISFPDWAACFLPANSFRICSSAKSSRKSFRIRTSKTLDLKSFRICSSEKYLYLSPSSQRAKHPWKVPNFYSDKEKLLLRWLGHHVAGLRRKPGSFQLNRHVVNQEGLVQFLANRPKNRFAFVHVHVRNARVAAHRKVIAAERPDMYIVYFHYPLNCQNRARHFFYLHILRTPFEQNMRGIAQNSNTRPQHQQTNRKAKHRVNPFQSRVVNRNRARNNRNIRERIAEIVNQDAAQVQVFVAAHHSQRDSAIYRQSRDRSPDHPAFDDCHGSAQPLDGLPSEPRGKQHEQHSVRKRRQRSRAMVAVRLIAIRRSLCPAHCNPRNAQRGYIGKVVHSVIQQRHAMPQQSAENLRNYQSQRRQHRPRQNARLQRRVNMPVP